MPRPPSCSTGACSSTPTQPGHPETGIVSNFIRAGRLERAQAVVERVMDDARGAGASCTGTA